LVLGIYGAIVVDAVSFVASALLIRSCKISEVVRLPNGQHHWRDLKFKSVLVDFKQGLLYILGNKLLLSLIVGFMILGIGNGGFSVMPAFILKYKLAPETYEEMMVIMGIILGAGILIGSVIATMLLNKLKRYQMILIGLVISGTFIGIAAIPTNIYIFFVLILVAALFLPFTNIGLGGWIPSIVDPKMMGRVQGCITPLMMLSQSITLGVIAVTYQKVVTIEGLFWIVSGCMLFVTVYYAIVLPKYSKLASNTSDDGEVAISKENATTSV
jgi:DHA3 family macrolide efflux protein-like MFS transporter